MQASGAQIVDWDGMDDDGVAITGEKTAKVLFHRIDYQWEGTVGNTTAKEDRTTQLRAQFPPFALAVIPSPEGTPSAPLDRIFLALGPKEHPDQGSCHTFIDSSNSDPTRVQKAFDVIYPFAAWPYRRGADLSPLTRVCADANKVYWARSFGYEL